MKIYFEPVNIKHWNIFEKVKSIGHIEPFIATKSMEIDDIVLLYIGKQDSKYDCGVYAVGKVVSELYIMRNKPQDYCNNRNTVDIEIVKMKHDKPLLTYKKFSEFNKQFRSVHVINEIYYSEILKLLEIDG